MIPMKLTPLSQLATVSAGQAAPKDDEFSEHGIPFVRAGSLDRLLSGKSESDLELVSDETAKLRRLKTYPQGTILFAKSGMSATKDRIYVLQNPAYVVSHLATLITNGNAHTDYLRLALKHFPPSVLIKDPAYPAISLGDIQNYEIPVPEQLDDQIRIAHLLGKVEGLIARRKQHLKQLDDLLKSVFLEIFGDPVRNEKGWEKKTAIDYADCIVPGRDKPKSFSGGTPWVTTGDLQQLGYTAKSRSGIGLSHGEIKVVRARVVPKSSVLLTCVGDLGVVSICTTDMVINQQLHAFQVSEAMTEEFFMYSLSYQKRYMYQNASQTTLPYMNKTVCNSTPMIRPPKDIQITFAKTVRVVHSIKARYQQSLADLEALYSALIQQAFKGELDLSRVPQDVQQPRRGQCK
jgi:type I restriction enzyme S subunit